MTEQRDLLIEIGTEELPPKALHKLSNAFKAGIEEGLEKAGLKHNNIQAYATPRRLAVLISDLVTAQEDSNVERRGPAVTAAFGEDGCPTPAATGFARSCGVEADQLETMETDKGAWLVFRSEQKGQSTAELVPAIVQHALDKLPIPKRMRWGNLDSEFVRPVHWLVLLFGDEVIDAEILSVKSGRETRGHRFHHPDTIYIGEPRAYQPLLESEGRVMADFAERREAIKGQVMEVAAKVKGTAVIDDALLDEVTGLVEWPVALLGNFDKEFLDMPSECLISAMKGHQKYFHVVDQKEQLMPHFITVSNIESSNPDVVRDGNERVIRPRLSDAEFFWTQDHKQKLADRIDSLKTVVFQNKLGTIYDKSQRVSQLAGFIASNIEGDKSLAERAALLAKCDLMSEMVGEFPELQGIMGRYYAEHDGEPANVAIALDEQYMPRFAGDDLPQSKTGQALAIAEKLDTLVGIFGIGQIPTGAKDPFALRRAALGALRIIIENNLELDLRDCLTTAASSYKDIFKADEVVPAVFDFMMDRLRAYYHDSGVSHDTFESVLALNPSQPKDFNDRILAVTAFRKLPEAESLAAANKRIQNILRQAAENKEIIPAKLDNKLLHESAEKLLAAQLEKTSKEVSPLFDKQDYQPALIKLATLRQSVDSFFDAVMVMAEDKSVRSNRLALLKQLGDLFLQVADISRLQS